MMDYSNVLKKEKFFDSKKDIVRYKRKFENLVVNILLFVPLILSIDGVRMAKTLRGSFIASAVGAVFGLVIIGRWLKKK